ncbi:uncharacterized protein METZ01_LOCUS510156, partial [marine metagenome]
LRDPRRSATSAQPSVADSLHHGRAADTI